MSAYITWTTKIRCYHTITRTAVAHRTNWVLASEYIDGFECECGTLFFFYIISTWYSWDWRLVLHYRGTSSISTKSDRLNVSTIKSTHRYIFDTTREVTIAHTIHATVPDASSSPHVTSRYSMNALRHKRAGKKSSVVVSCSIK